MGIKHLNRYLTNQCSEKSISKCSFAEIRNKIVVVDTSIYLYKFVESNSLVEGIYSMISVFRKYGIIPLFVFDGKPPPEKTELLEKRRKEKQQAEEKYNILKTRMTETAEQEPELLTELESLKKRFVRIRYADIQMAKNIMTAYGISYIESCGEADQLCAYLVRKNYAWACVSDDMDMFLYGCNRVIRHLSILNHTGILYNTESILEELGMDFAEFRDIMVLSGTDYNIRESTSLYETLKLFSKYKTSNSGDSFYGWLLQNTKYVRNLEQLEKVREMFDLSGFPAGHQDEIRSIISKMPFQNKPAQKDELRAILSADGFLFV
jgi:5'-3' exonuclease